MKLEVIKKGQGKYARGVAYLLIGLLMLFGAIRLFATINVRNKLVLVEDLPVIGDLTGYKLIAVGLFSISMLIVHLILNRPAMVDLLIDTEQEMKKVSWPSKREVQSATIVVVIVTFVIATMLFGFDELLHALFQLIF